MPALVAYLALHAGQSLPRDALATLLWPDHPQAAAYINLRQTLSRVHKALGDGASTLLEVTRQSVCFTSSSLTIDVARIETVGRTALPIPYQHNLELHRFAAQAAELWRRRSSASTDLPFVSCFAFERVHVRQPWQRVPANASSSCVLHRQRCKL